MTIDVVMPKMGESITEGTIIEWKKQVGDKIERDETLLEISTDKVDSEVPSPDSGTLIEILFDINQTVDVGTVIARIGDANEKNDSIEKTEKTIDNVEKNIEKDKLEPKLKKEVKSKQFFSPLVKSIAREHKITDDELTTIIGSGKSGRVNKNDIMNYLEINNNSLRKPQLIDIPSQPQSPGGTVIENPKPQLDKLEDKIEPMGRMRSRISHHMLNSQKTSAHVYSTSEVDVTKLVNLRTKFKSEFKSQYGLNLTYTPMILDACIKALHEFPLLNASIDGENIIHHAHINMGVAVALPDNNLIVPVIKDSEEKNFIGLARSTADIAIRARENKLSPEEIFGSTFTVTNPGIFGSLFGMGIINQPNVGILSTGSIHKRPVVKETEFGDVVVVRHMMYLTLGYDHRLIDGAYGTRFLSKLVTLIECYNESRLF
jgi:2-oxoglutarate dehydrogenase E2 component (dihydrolipoamide succinyltransferase)